MENITVQEFAKQIGDSHVNVIPNKYCGEVMAILLTDTSVVYDEKENVLTFLYGCRPSLTIKVDGIENITVTNERCYLITLVNDETTFTVAKLSETK